VCKDIKKKEGIEESITEADYEEEGTTLSEVEQAVEDMLEMEVPIVKEDTNKKKSLYTENK